MKFEIKDCVQRGHYYAIVDEVDSILIDEARTPLIISGPTDQTTDKYAKARQIVPNLVKGEEIEASDTQRCTELGLELREGEKFLTGDYIVDEKQRTIGVTDEGWVTIEKLLGITNIADAENWEMKHYVETAIKAEALYKRDVEYVVKDGEVIIVDTFTGRLMPGRRWSDGLHQSIEAKEGVSIRKEDQTLATITFQNYFRLYKKLSGMTGTAETEAAEFEKIYKLEIVVIPTNKPLLRLENPDVVYLVEKAKYKAVADWMVQHFFRAAHHEAGKDLRRWRGEEVGPHPAACQDPPQILGQIAILAGPGGLIEIKTLGEGVAVDQGVVTCPTTKPKPNWSNCSKAMPRTPRSGRALSTFRRRSLGRPTGVSGCHLTIHSVRVSTIRC